ncbi:MAG: DUF3108 domain-containing protein [Verrucomicrobiae bacterium]|nr:DUF3108 domain-containing protein [Verrucomicrobiae bacterium]
MKYWFLVIVFISNELYAAPFQVGEKLTYQATWGPFVAADLTFEVASPFQPDQWRFQGFCRSRGLVETFYPIESRVESRALKSPFVTTSFYENRKEGTRRLHRYMELDFQNKWGLWYNYISGDIKKLKLKEGSAVDLFSAVYYARSLNWTKDQTRQINVFYNGKYRPLSFTAQNFRETNVPHWGKQKTFELVCSEIFQAATDVRGKLIVIATADERHIPLEARLDVKWGTVNLFLTQAENVTGAPLKYSK